MSAVIEVAPVEAPPRATLRFEGDGVDVRAEVSPAGAVLLTVRYDTPGDRGNWVSLTGSPAEIEATLNGLSSALDVVVDAVASLAPAVPAAVQS